jgi:hypothetical protein
MDSIHFIVQSGSDVARKPVVSEKELMASAASNGSMQQHYAV